MPFRRLRPTKGNEARSEQGYGARLHRQANGAVRLPSLVLVDPIRPRRDSEPVSRHGLSRWQNNGTPCREQLTNGADQLCRRDRLDEKPFPDIKSTAVQQHRPQSSEVDHGKPRATDPQRASKGEALHVLRLAVDVGNHAARRVGVTSRHRLILIRHNRRGDAVIRQASANTAAASSSRSTIYTGDDCRRSVIHRADPVVWRVAGRWDHLVHEIGGEPGRLLGGSFRFSHFDIPM